MNMKNNKILKEMENNTNGNVLLLHQTKPNTVVPYSYVGIGGKGWQKI